MILEDPLDDTSDFDDRLFDAMLRHAGEAGKLTVPYDLAPWFLRRAYGDPCRWPYGDAYIATPNGIVPLVFE